VFILSHPFSGKENRERVTINTKEISYTSTVNFEINKIQQNLKRRRNVSTTTVSFIQLQPEPQLETNRVRFGRHRSPIVGLSLGSPDPGCLVELVGCRCRCLGQRFAVRLGFATSFRSIPTAS
jgi:hypothetical protein